MTRPAPARRPKLIVAALSGRALAAAAARDGYEPVVIDLFRDLDTHALAPNSRKCAGSIERGFDALDFIETLRAIARGALGMVYGAGFEARPELLIEAARIRPLFGAPPAVLTRAKDPATLARVLAELGLPHPEISLGPRSDAGWLVKRLGGAGGAHVTRHSGGAPPPGHYLQREAAGWSVSLLVLRGARARVLGASRQWVDPTPASPFRYGGCAGPIPIEDAMAEAATRLCDALELVGLASVDFLVTEEGFTILEVNPRPGATQDIFPELPLIAWHLGAKAMPRATLGTARAAAVLFAPTAAIIPVEDDWPEWVADVPAPGEAIPTGAPICTILAEAATVDAARGLIDSRKSLLLDRLITKVTP